MFVIIGGVAAGMSAASQIKRRKADARVVVLERGQDVSYGACGMPYNLADPGREIEDLVVVTAQEFIEKRGLDLRLGHEVREIDRENKMVRGLRDDGTDFEISYHTLVIATGSRAVLPDVPGIDSPGVFTLRTLRDLADSKAWLEQRECREAVVIGGSYLGLELAEALCARGIKATIVKRSPVMLHFLPQDFDELVRTELDRHGVSIIHGSPIKSIEKDGRLKVILADQELEANVVMVATGFAPRSKIGLAAGLEQGAGSAIAVDDHGRTSDPSIFSCGDCCDGFHHITGERVWVPLALHANRAGRIVGANAAGADETMPPILGTSAVKVFDLEVAATGLSIKEAKEKGFDPVSATIKTRTRAHAFPGARNIHVHLVADKKDSRLLGGAVVGEEKAALRVDVIATALHNNMTVEKFADMDLMYSPPFAPAWDPLLVCANQLVKKVG